MGSAEKDPSLDIDGWDTVAKVVILANAMMGALISLSNGVREGIGDITRQEVERARRNSQVIELIGSARQKADKLRLEVRPKSISVRHPLAGAEDLRRGSSFTPTCMVRSPSIAVIWGWRPQLLQL